MKRIAWKLAGAFTLVAGVHFAMNGSAFLSGALLGVFTSLVMWER